MIDDWVADWEPSSRYPHYTRANAGEVMPEPVSPLGWSLAWERAIGPGWRDGNIEFGAYTPEDLDPARPEIIGLFGGHLYVGLSACRLVGARMPGMTVEDYDYAAFGGHADVPRYVPHPDDENPACTEALGRRLRWVMSVEEWPELDRDRGRAERLRSARPVLADATPAELVARARDMLDPLREAFARHVVSTLGSTVGPGVIASVCDTVGDPSAANRLIGAIGNVDSALPAHRLWQLSRIVRSTPGLAGALAVEAKAAGPSTRTPDHPDAEAFAEEFRRFLADHGCRGPNVWDLRALTWELDARSALAAVLTMSGLADDQSPQARFAQARSDRERLLAEMDLDAGARATLTAALASSSRFLAWRERTKTTAVMVLHEMRMPLLELGRRAAEHGVLAEPRDVTMLMDGELDGFAADQSAFTDVLAGRLRGYRELFELEPPFIIADAAVPPLTDWPRRRTANVTPIGAGERLTGLPGCAGVARGRVRIAHDLADAAELEPGEVLVCRTTDPSWTPMFVSAAAVVVETGAQISHAVIVSRELGVPCVISAAEATDRLPEGAYVEVDGTRGTVTVLEEG